MTEILALPIGVGRSGRLQRASRLDGVAALVGVMLATRNDFWAHAPWFGLLEQFQKIPAGVTDLPSHADAINTALRALGETDVRVVMVRVDQTPGGERRFALEMVEGRSLRPSGLSTASQGAIVHSALQVSVGSSLVLRNSEIEGMVVTHALGDHLRCTISFYRDRDTDLSLDQLLGTPMTITATDEEGAITLFEGEVSGGAQGHQLNRGSSFVIDGISLSVRFDRCQTNIYPQATVADVAGKLGARFSAAAAGGAPLEYVQFEESDLEFLRRLADEQGMWLRPVGNTFEVCDAFEDTGVAVVWGRDLLSVTARCAPRSHGVEGAAHEFQQKLDHRFRGTLAAPEWMSGAALMTDAAARLAQRRHGEWGNVVSDNLPPRSRDVAAARASLERESARLLGTSVFVDGSATNFRVSAGAMLTLEEPALQGEDDPGTFRLPTRGDFGVVQVRHVFDGHQYSNEFVATPWASWTNESRPARTRIAGPITGTVEDNCDPKGMGRLKVRLRYLDSAQSTRWIRVMTPYAGNGRGLHALPEKGDEVLVAFELGDPERPIVMGSVNGKDLAPAADQNVAKRFVSRSGNTIQFFDEPGGKERVEAFTATGACWIQMTNAGGTPLVTIHSEGDIALEAKNEVRITCKSLTQRVSGSSYRKVGGAESAEIGGGLSLVVKGKLAMQAATMVLKAQSMFDAAAGGILSILGSLVHIQPPGKQVPAVTVKAPDAPKSTWAKTAVPKLADETTDQHARLR